MIKHKKIIICFLLSYALFIVGIFDAKALDINELKDFTQLQFNSDFDATEFWNTDQDAVAVFTKTFNIGTYDNGADYIVYQGFIDLFSYKSTKTNTMDPTYIKYATKVYLTTQDNEIVICENNMTESGYIICRNPKKMVNTISFFTSFNTLGTALDDNYFFKVHLYKTFWYANKSEEDNTTIANNTTDIKDSINDSSIDTNNTSSSTTSWGNKNASNGTITNLLTLPISLLQAIVNGIQSTCSSFSLGSLFGTNIILPCINIGTLIGSGLWSTIDILFSGFMILAIAKKLIKIFNDFTNLKTNQVDELYGGGK